VGQQQFGLLNAYLPDMKAPIDAERAFCLYALSGCAGCHLQQRQIGATIRRSYPLAQVQGNMRKTPRAAQTRPYSVSSAL